MITEEEQFMIYTKPKPKKDSLLDFNKVLETEEQRINFLSKLSIQTALNVIIAAVMNTT